MKKVFIGMGEIAGYYSNLAIGLRENGYKVSEFYLTDHRFNYQEKIIEPKIFALSKIFKRKVIETKGNILKKGFFYSLYLLSYNVFFIWALWSFDFFIFGYTNTIYQSNNDLIWLRRFGKKVISNVAHGSESRPAYINGAFGLPDGTFLEPKELIELTKRIKKKISYIEKNSDFVISAPLTSHFLTKPFVNHFDIGLPFKKKLNNDTPPKLSLNNPVRILHSPSKPHAKGTWEIRECIQRLKNRGFNIDYVEVINQPNFVVIQELQKCDFIVDQVYSDTPLAGFATEAAFYGKPAIVGGYGWKKLIEILKPHNLPPSEICHPRDLEVSMEKLITNKQYRLGLGKKAKQFVTKNWEAGVVAKKYVKLFKGEVNKDWVLDPKHINYVHGVGISEENAKNLVKKTFEFGGRASLHLSHRKNLEKSFIDFMQS